MDDLPVATIAHHRRCQQLRRGTFRQAGQEAAEPASEVCTRQHATHQVVRQSEMSGGRNLPKPLVAAINHDERAQTNLRSSRPAFLGANVRCRRTRTLFRSRSVIPAGG
jgi:hypothetical protein